MHESPFSYLADHEIARFVDVARDFAESGRAPATPRLAATVALMRSDLTVFLMRRSMGMVFGGRWAFPGGSADLADAAPPGPCYDPDAESGVARRAAAREVLEETELQLDPADLIPWSRWITPEFEPRRFDTYFFVGLVGDDAPLDVRNGEADATGWFSPAEAVAGHHRGTMPMLPPTVVTLIELAEYRSIAEMVAAARLRDATKPVLPRLPGR